MRSWMLAAGATAALVAGAAEAKTFKVAPGPQAEDEVRGAIQQMRPGDQLRLARGRYEFVRPVMISSPDITIRGQSPEATIISFLGQLEPGPGLNVTATGVTLRGLAVENAKGVGLKAEAASGLTLREIRVEWTGGPSAGPAGVSIERARDVYITQSLVRGAGVAGFHVGASQNVVIRDSTAERNGAGFVLENVTGADLYGSTAARNGVGVAITHAPGLGGEGRNLRVFENRIIQNDLVQPETAPLPSGVGVVVTGAKNVHIFQNDIANHGGANIFVGAYAGRLSEAGFNPLPQDVSIRSNKFGAAGLNPTGALRRIVEKGAALPDVLWDGATTFVADGRPAQQPVRIHLKGNDRIDGREITTLSLEQPIAGGGLEDAAPRPGIVSAPEIEEPDPVAIQRR